MALKSIIRKRHAETQIDSEPSPSRIRFNDEIVFSDNSHFSLPKNSKMTFNSNQMKSQIFGLPKPIMDYILKAANGKVMKKFYRSCKYIYQRNPMCIVDVVKTDGIGVERKWYEIYESPMSVFHTIENIWILCILDLKRSFGFDKFLQKIVRCDAKSITLPDFEISKNLFDIFTKSKRVINWNSSTTTIMDVGNENFLTIENLFHSLPNADNICAKVNGNLDGSIMLFESRKNKIEWLELHIDGNEFDPDKYYKLFENILTPYAFVRLSLRYPNLEEYNSTHIEKFGKLQLNMKNKWKKAAVEKPKIILGGYIK